MPIFNANANLFTGESIALVHRVFYPNCIQWRYATYTDQLFILHERCYINKVLLLLLLFQMVLVH